MRAAIQNDKLFVYKRATKHRQAGVIIIHSCGTKQWIGNSFYDAEYPTSEPVLPKIDLLAEFEKNFPPQLKHTWIR